MSLNKAGIRFHAATSSSRKITARLGCLLNDSWHIRHCCTRAQQVGDSAALPRQRDSRPRCLIGLVDGARVRMRKTEHFRDYRILSNEAPMIIVIGTSHCLLQMRY